MVKEEITSAVRNFASVMEHRCFFLGSTLKRDPFILQLNHQVLPGSLLYLSHDLGTREKLVNRQFFLDRKQ